MATTPSVELTHDELASLFDALDIWSKVEDGRLSDDPIIKARRPARAYEGGVSDIVKHRNAAGFHVATTHRIQMPDGTTPHWHAKDIRIGDLTLWRGESREP